MTSTKMIIALITMLGTAMAHAGQCDSNNTGVQGTYTVTTTGWSAGASREPFNAIAVKRLKGGVVTPLYQLLVQDGVAREPLVTGGTYQVSAVAGAKGTCLVVFTFAGGYQNTGLTTDNGNHISVIGNGGTGFTTSTEYVRVAP
jgi:hypothetical protein